MCRKMSVMLLSVTVCVVWPALGWAQGSLGDNVYSLHKVLDHLYDEMMPMCENLIDVGRAIAGFAAIWYIGTRVWKHIARAEPIDFYPLLRPFAIGMVVGGLYPHFIALMNGVLKPIVVATKAMGDDSHRAIAWHIQQEEAAAGLPPPPGIVPGTGSSDNKWDKYEQPGSNDNQGSSGLGGIFSMLSLKNTFKLFISQTVQIIYSAAGLCINTIRTFYLIILAIIGPLVLGISVFDGFQNTLNSWIARYINVYMWLPVANIFGAITSKILENMMNQDQSFFSTTAYIIFMLISIVGYLTVPNVAGYIVQAGGKDTLLHKVTQMAQQAPKVLLK